MRKVNWKIKGVYRIRLGAMSTRMMIGLCVGIPILLFALIIVPIAIALILPAVQQSREAALRMQSKNNLKLIGLAMHNYYDVYNTFPPSSVVAIDFDSSKMSSTEKQSRQVPDTEVIPGANNHSNIELDPSRFSSFDEYVTASEAANPTPKRRSPFDRPLDFDSTRPGEIRTPHHGWMTALLPYFEQAEIYNRVDFHQPWTSPENAPIFRQEVTGYLHPGVLRTDPTSSRVGENGASHYAGNSQLLKPNAMCQFRDITDGSSNTIMAGEVNNGFRPWGSPDNVRDPAAGIGKSSTQFGCHVEEVAQFLLCDGSVRLITTKTSQEIMKYLADPRDGQQLSEF